MAMAGESGLLRKDCSALRIPYLPRTETAAPQPPDLELPLYSYQLRNIHRMQIIEGYANGGFKTDFGTWLHYKPRGGVIADSTGLGKTASVIGLIMSEPRKSTKGPTLVVVPTHLTKQWVDEVAKFTAGRLEVVQGIAAFERREAADSGQGPLDNRVVVIVDVNEVLEAKRVWYDFRKVYRCKTFLKRGWVLTKVDNREVYLHPETGRQRSLSKPPLTHQPDQRTMVKLRVTEEAREVYMAAARHVTGAYTGWVYTSGLHMPKKGFRRVIFDEVHDLIDSNSDGSGSVWQNNLMQLTRCADRVWCMSATPFPKGNRSIYGINQLLGFKRLKLEVENGNWDACRTFELIKQRLYIRNHESVRDEVIGNRVTVRHETIRPQFTTIESANYHAIAHQLQQGEGGRLDPFSAACEELRRICCHPACSEALAAAFAIGSAPGGGTTAGRGRRAAGVGVGPAAAPASVEEFSDMMVRGRKAQLDTMVKDRREALASAKLWANSAALGDYLHQFGSHGVLDSEGSDATLRRLVTAESDSPRIATYNPRCSANQPCSGCTAQPRTSCLHIDHLPDTLDALDEIRGYIRGHLSTADKQRRFQQHCQNKVATLRGELVQLNRDVEALTRRVEYFRSVLAAVEGCSADGLECPVCFENRPLMTVNLDCGHHTCTPCMSKVLGLTGRADPPSCVHCRKVLDPAKLMKVNVGRKRSSGGATATGESGPGGGAAGVVEAGLDTTYGAKPAALVTFLRRVLSEPANKVIVFSMWTSALRLVGDTLTKCEIPNVWCKGSRGKKEAAMRLFCHSDEVNVLMLTADASASGTNLQIANHVVLLDPPGMNPAQGAALEQQAIARSVRIGQTRTVTVTRFVMAGTLEEELAAAIAAKQDRRVQHTAVYYKCASADSLYKPPPTVSKRTSPPARPTETPAPAAAPKGPSAMEVDAPQAVRLGRRSGSDPPQPTRLMRKQQGLNQGLKPQRALKRWVPAVLVGNPSGRDL